MTQSNPQLERNKEWQGTRDQDAAMREIRFDGEDWVEGWYLADGLGILLQLDALNMPEKPGCKPV